MRIERLLASYDLRAVWIHFPLHPETPAAGRSLEDLFAGRNYDLQAMKAKMKRLMDAEGLPYGRRTHTFKSRLAQELATRRITAVTYCCPSRVTCSTWG